jgi:hypothetical protein
VQRVYVGSYTSKIATRTKVQRVAFVVVCVLEYGHVRVTWPYVHYAFPCKSNVALLAGLISRVVCYFHQAYFCCSLTRMHTLEKGHYKIKPAYCAFSNPTTHALYSATITYSPPSKSEGKHKCPGRPGGTTGDTTRPSTLTFGLVAERAARRHASEHTYAYNM